MNSHNNAIINASNNNDIPLCSIYNNNFKIISDPESGEIICKMCGIVLSDEAKKLPIHPRDQEEMTVISHANTVTITSTNTNTHLKYNENNNNN